jgi:tRNA modification GTPase
MSLGETIAAISTPSGQGGVGIVRISGPQAWEVGLAVFRDQSGGTLPAAPSPRHLILGRAVEPSSDEPIDQVLCAFFPAPHSYTTEDTVEIQAHAGTLVLRRILAACLSAGARLARPGEFTLRAVMGGRLDLAQAEGVGQLIAARSDQEARLALASLDGILSRKLAPIRTALEKAAASVEVAVDFPDEAPEILAPELRTNLESLALYPLRQLIDRGSRRRVFREGALIALVGRPNVGKSSLFNALLGQPRAITNPQPGTTRDSIEEALILGGVVCRVSDTAGLAQAGDELESLGMAASRKVLGMADLACLVLDQSEPLSTADQELIQALDGRPCLLVLNKIDLPAAWDAGALEPEYPKQSVSALTGQGMDELAAALGDMVAGGEPEPVSGEALASDRQRHALENCLAAAGRAAEGLRQDDPQVEIISLELAEALTALGEVDGRGAPDEVIEAVFDNFCVGK